MTGKVQRFSARNGWGWIDTTAAPVFVHAKDVADLMQYGAPAVGQTVEFELGADERGRSRAVRVRRVRPPSLLARVGAWLTCRDDTLAEMERGLRATDVRPLGRG